MRILLAFLPSRADPQSYSLRMLRFADDAEWIALRSPGCNCLEVDRCHREHEAMCNGKWVIIFVVEY